MFGKSKGKFRPDEFVESFDELVNPARGWYRIIPYNLEYEAAKNSSGENKDVDLTDEKEIINATGNVAQAASGTGLVLLRIDIKEYKETEIGDKALFALYRIIKSWVDAGYDIIFRACYDTQGKGYDNEPSDSDLIRKHMEELASVLVKFKDNIFVVQGLLIGAWGEMHSSRYIYGNELTGLYTTYRDALKGIPIAVRTPKMWRDLAAEPGINASEERMSLFNDALLGSETDLGTYADNDKDDGKPGKSWSRDSEYDFQTKNKKTCSNGGEVVGTGPYTDFIYMQDGFKSIGLSYLNIGYDPKTIEKWKSDRVTEKGAWRGKSVFDYVGAHMGYRFLVKEVRYRKGDGWDEYNFVATLENTGFAPPYFELEAVFSAEQIMDTEALKKKKERILAEAEEEGIDPPKKVSSSGESKKVRVRLKQLPDEKTLEARATLPLTAPKGSNFDIYLKLERKCDQKHVFTAMDGKRGRAHVGILTL